MFEPNHYLTKILTEIPRRRGLGVQHIRVAHEAWCPLLNGRGSCGCDADVTEVTEEQAIKNIAYERMRRGRKPWKGR